MRKLRQKLNQNWKQLDWREKVQWVIFVLLLAWLAIECYKWMPEPVDAKFVIQNYETKIDRGRTPQSDESSHSEDEQPDDRVEEITEQDIKEMIRKKFGEDADRAIKVFGCESRYNPEIVGDKDLAFWRDGELVGRSIGIAQIRTGGPGWNRAEKYGMTIAEFEEALKDPEFNLSVARDIYPGNWYPWYNCAKAYGYVR